MERVSHESGFTETYYKQLQKAYNAVSGIGEAYDVVNEDGNTVLTYIEDPEHTAPRTPSRAADNTDYDYLRYAHEVEDDIRWAEENKQREFDEREKQLAKQRKRLAKSGRASQMQLFGCGYTKEIESELYEIWREQIEYGETKYDYETWRRVVGDEYAKDVMRFF